MLSLLKTEAWRPNGVIIRRAASQDAMLCLTVREEDQPPAAGHVVDHVIPARRTSRGFSGRVKLQMRPEKGELHGLRADLLHFLCSFFLDGQGLNYKQCLSCVLRLKKKVEIVTFFSGLLDAATIA